MSLEFFDHVLFPTLGIIFLCLLGIEGVDHDRKNAYHKNYAALSGEEKARYDTKKVKWAYKIRYILFILLLIGSVIIELFFEEYYKRFLCGIGAFVFLAILVYAKTNIILDLCKK